MIYLLLVLLSISIVRADYTCLCTYNRETGVYPMESDQSKPIGYLYEFDCKPVVSESATSSNWTIIAFGHQKGYILKNSMTRVEVCQGEPPDADQLSTDAGPNSNTSLTTVTMETSSSTTETTTSSLIWSITPDSSSTNIPTTTTTTFPTSQTTDITTTTATTPPATMLTSTVSMIDGTSDTTTTTTFPTSKTTEIPTTTTATLPSSMITSTARTLACPSSVQQNALREGSTLFINYNDQSCYEMVTHVKSWKDAEKDCNLRGGHLATIGDSMDEKSLYNAVKSYGHPTWIGLNDRNNEETFVWASGEPVVYLNWRPGRKDIYLHSTEDCVAMGPHTGTWEDMDCSVRYAYICEYDAVYGRNNDTNIQFSTPPPTGMYTDGNTMMCESSVQSAALNDSAVLSQYRSSCYELISDVRVTWHHGESMCKDRGGHLVHVSNADEQGFIQYFMERYSPQHAVWIGLHDTRVEGQFEWSSGVSVSFTNWVPRHEDDFGSHNIENCVAFIPYKKGQWDDIRCGESMKLVGDVGEVHPILCQYDLETSAIVG